jgi:hypothetical protein
VAKAHASSLSGVLGRRFKRRAGRGALPAGARAW